MLTRAVMGAAGSAREDFEESTKLASASRCHVIDNNPLTSMLWASDFNILLRAACSGTGVALLPTQVVERALSEGRRVRILPKWHSENVTIHLVFMTKCGLASAVRDVERCERKACQRQRYDADIRIRLSHPRD